MLTSLFKKAEPASDWALVRKKVERASTRLFASVGTPCVARAFTVPTDAEPLLLVELRAEVEWTSQSMKAAKAILIQGLNSELGFRLRNDDLIVAFVDARPEPAVAPLAKPKKAPILGDFHSSVVVTEVSNSQWSAFSPTDTAEQRDEPDTVMLGKSRSAKR